MSDSLPSPMSAEEQRIADIRSREQAATAGPWTVFTIDNPQVVVRSESGFIANTLHGNDGANARFIAHARSDVPWLVAQVAEQEVCIAALKNQILEMARTQ